MKIELEPRDGAAPGCDTGRRQFCQVAAIGAVSLLIQSCGGSSPAGPSGSVTVLPVLIGTAGTSSITVNVDSSSPLANVGGMALVQAANGSVLVARTGQTTFAAVSATCTHQACQITNFSGSSYVCPCHGSQFSTSGQVLSGPAPSSLRAFTTQFVSNVLTISG